ncbi:hypothetical protein ADN00_13235 [Ornatilinea apprima]|uniref:Uncharacterized protein n=1 Tax=Ornatilinea apprima TaxID=1134406 RepID=A0A0P6X629_9CHLR|nr:hypothetical protein [Ornatilinea apprima]KPL74805.1 hypothetical protein ADN00_13235 [Ornatilinea apprima]
MTEFNSFPDPFESSDAPQQPAEPAPTSNEMPIPPGPVASEPPAPATEPEIPYTPGEVIPPMQEAYTPPAAPPAKKSNKTIWIILAVVLILICLCCVILAIVAASNYENIMKDFNLTLLTHLLVA